MIRTIAQQDEADQGIVILGYGQGMAKENNLPASIIDIMTEMREILDLPGMTNQSYSDMVTGWLIVQGVKP